MGLEVRPSEDGDVGAITAIYAHYVATSDATFEEVAPSPSEMAARRRDVVERGLPYLVAVSDGAVVAYAYAHPYRGRIGYRHSLEDSIYVDPRFAGRGIGRKLLEEILRIATGAGYRQMVAVIGGRANRSSIRLHLACGFREVGALTAIGCKFGKWVDTIFMQRALGEGDRTLPP
jgi:phosphinothricin acetyltransferase